MTVKVKPKILYAVPDLDKFGGIQQYAKSQAEHLNSISDITLVGWKSPASIIDHLQYRFGPNGLSSWWYAKRHRGGTEGQIDFRDYDLVHAWRTDIAVALPKNIKTIISCYGLEILVDNLKPFKKEAFGTALKAAYSIVAVSNFTKEYLIENYSINPNKIHVILPGVDLDKFRYSSSKNNGSKVVIGTLTRLVERKNLLNIIKALSILKKDYKLDFEYRLIGDGPQRELILNALQQSGIEYSYSRSISDTQKGQEFYPSLDVFVLPPLQTAKDVEGFGIVFIEANACGVPVVAARTGGVSDAVSEGISGLFADPLDPEDIAAKIAEIIKSENDYRTSSYIWAKNFKQIKTAQGFQELYERSSL